MGSEEVDLVKSDPGVLRVYGQYMKLRKSGDKYVGKCCLHGENTPSFTVFPDMRFQCFGCGVAGNIMQLVQKMDNCDFRTALEKVKKELGSWGEAKEKVDRVFKPVAEPKVYKTIPLDQWTKLESALESTQEAIKFLQEQRGISLETAKSLRLGFVQNIGKLAGEGGEDIAAGGWIAFPSIDGDKITSIKYRSIVRKKPNGFARQPGMATALFNTETISPFDALYVTEGEFDAIILEQAGFKAISLPNATAKLTPEQKDKIMQASEVILAGDTDETGSGAMSRLWKELGDRTYLLSWPDGAKDANEYFLTKCDRDVSLFRTKVEELTIKAKSQPMPSVYSLQETLLSGEDTNISDSPDRMRFPWPGADTMVNIMPGDVVAVNATNALINGTKVVTPVGLKPVEDLVVGEHVMGSNGRPTRVLAVLPKGERVSYKITFSDGLYVHCDAEHLWGVEDRFIKKSGKEDFYRVLQTQEILDEIKRGKMERRFTIPFSSAAIFENKDLPLSPYVLGALLGDGSFKNYVRFAADKNELEIIDRIKEEIPSECVMVQYPGDQNHWYIRNNNPRGKNQVREALEELGLLGKGTGEKFIPDSYLFASKEQRLSLLQGIMDADGTCGKTGIVRFSNSCLSLTKNVLDLVLSLGGYGKISKAADRSSRSPEYTLHFSLEQGLNPFYMKRKAERYDTRTFTKTKRRYIVSIEKDQIFPMTCIAVEAEDGLFALEHFLLTHNTGMGKTSFVVQWTLFNARKYGRTILNYQTEMRPSEIATMVAANVLRKDRNFLTVEDKRQAAKEIDGVQYYVGSDPTLSDINQVLDLLEAAIRRLSPYAVVLDHFHHLTAGIHNEAQVQSAAMTRIKSMAQIYKVVFINVGQPRKANQQTRGKQIHITDAKGSAAYADAANAVITIHRDLNKSEDPTQTKGVYEDKTLVKLLKGRSMGTGNSACYLTAFGEYSSFEQIDTTHEAPNEEFLNV